MASGITPKVRLVRCPKCRLVLPEVADFLVYKCGGCETILVAKNRKALVKSTSDMQETEAAHADKLVHVSEHGESSSSRLQEVLPSLPEFCQESGGNQNISTDSHSEKLGENLSIEGQHNDHYEKDQNTSSDNDCDKLEENISNEGQENGSGQLQLESLEYCNIQQPGVSIEVSLSTELHHENEELMFVAEANLETEANDKTSQLGAANSELETNSKIDSNKGGSSIDNTPATREINLTATACAVSQEVIPSGDLFSSPNESPEQPQKSEHHGFDRVRSTDTFESADFVSLSSELSGPFEYLSKSTTTRSSHAYYGSISSYDGMDDHFPGQQIHSFKNTSRAGNYLVPEERHRMGKLPAKGMMNGNSGMRDHARNFSSDSSNKKHYATEKYSKWHQDEMLESVTHRPLRNWPRLERDEYPSQIPFSQRASLHGYESAGPSLELHDEFPVDSVFHRLDKAEYTEQENMKLLRMVYELQDQISKACHLNRKPNGRTSTDVPWRQKHFPTYDYPEPHEEEFYPTYHGRRGQRSSWSQQSRFSHIPLSGGAMNTGHIIDNSCSCSHPQDWKRSEQLPPPIFRHNRGFCRAHPDYNCYNSYSSCLSSPQRCLESDFSIWSHETKSDDRRYKDHELKRYLGEKHNSVRRHLRPTAGGAPFVTCYSCFRPLQLPADFLLFKRRFHQLRCGACSKGNADVKHVSCSSSKPMEPRKDFVLKQSQNKHKNSMETFDSAGPSSNMSRWEKVSSEIEQLPPRTGSSPLHKLMGYSSPSQLINGSESPAQSHSTLPNTQD
ncbi:protein ENHANCED DISEASE RESISTANCE 4 isoform X2 [Durio zibethinus]|uniref:Protein ENHANCED DISEASE RESISTANCE 4 isoform X2 n=1 Tax=Durio zibethinus TaxID=66656 RepID=A0A6P5YXV8_DURZI|nr:protein ENHANCED DISEASE RESISTANCE 4 isoform X2 [Durio zibethinus]